MADEEKDEGSTADDVDGSESTTSVTDPDADSSTTESDPNADSDASGDDPDPADDASDPAKADDSGEETESPELIEARAILKEHRDRAADAGRTNRDLESRLQSANEEIDRLKGGNAQGDDSASAGDTSGADASGADASGGDGSGVDIDHSAIIPGTAYIPPSEFSSDSAQAARQQAHNGEILKAAVQEGLQEIDEMGQQVKSVVGRMRSKDFAVVREEELQSIVDMGVSDEVAKDVLDLESTGKLKDRRASRRLLQNALEKSKDVESKRKQQLDEQERVSGMGRRSLANSGNGNSGLSKARIDELKKMGYEAKMDEVGKIAVKYGEEAASSLMSQIGLV